jgi:hypothetical protein
MDAGLGEKGDWRALEALIPACTAGPWSASSRLTSGSTCATMTQVQRQALMARVLDDHPGLAALVPHEMRTDPAPRS